MSDNNELPPKEDVYEDDHYELSPEQATKLKPTILNRKKVLIFICVTFALVVCGGLILNSLKPKKNKVTTEAEMHASNTSSEFLNSLQNRALSRRDKDSSAVSAAEIAPAVQEEPPKADEALLPPALISNSSQAPDTSRTAPPPSQAPSSSGAAPSSSRPEPPPTHFRSSLVPPVEGSLFAQPQNTQTAQANSTGYKNPMDDYYAALAANRNASSNTTPSNPYGNLSSNYAQQNNQENKQSFYDASTGGTTNSGFYLGDNALWTGTIIPGVLETSINTDLPGNVLARITQNIYDSQTGRKLLLPQGTLLLARYNSSISYAQHRVQIVWDTMIRPDGYQIELDGANGVDRSGMSGQAARYHENWFEYLKAAGIITLFSIANARMTESAAKYATESSSANIAESNAALVNQLGGNLAGRAMNIQPTLTVDNGTLINIMLNKTLYLPPIPNYPATQKYRLE